jgi:L-ascorbate metabolism protein UlaG (beta-lactamase superfamily)
MNSKSKIGSAATRIRSGKAGSCPDGEKSLRVGLLPEAGWQKRNLQFIQRILIPSIFSKRTGAEQLPDFPELDEGQIGITWIGHATFLIQVGGMNILVDPNWAMWHSIVKRVRRPGIKIEHLPPIDAVLVSHAHHDHLHLPSLREVANQQPILVPAGVGKIVHRRGFGEVREMGYWESFEFGDIEIIHTPAQHWGARFVHDTHRSFGGYLIKYGGRAIYHCGDSAYFDGFGEIGEHCDIDVALMPIGAYGAPSGRAVHMNPEEALDAFGELGAKMIVPMHYGTFPLGQEPIHEPLERLVSEANRRGVAEQLKVLAEGRTVIF